MSFRWLACGVVLIGCLVTARSRAEDKVTVVNGSGEENGIIFWGSRQDWGTFTGDTYAIHDVDIGTWNEMVAFTKGRPPALDGAVKWSRNADSISLPYPDAFEVPVKVWVLCANTNCTGVPDSKKTKLAEYLVWANERLLDERAGFSLVPAGDDWIADETEVGGAPHDDLMDFDRDKCGKFDNAIQTIKAPNAINLYMVDKVDGDNRFGRHCLQNYDSAVIGYRVSAGTMLHEIGHIFSLGHTDGMSGIGDEKNMMWSRSSTRRYFTEGQVFRIHFSVDSGFNQSLSHVPNLPQNRLPRDCTSTTELPCPAVEMMIWTDK